jgi:hypothetical protein
MTKKKEEKAILKKEKANYHKEILSLKKIVSDYKVERKTNWKSFKNKMNDDIDKIEKSIDKLTIIKN